MDVDYGGGPSNPGGSSGGGGDDDFDMSAILKKFSCMNTEDHESLINQFTQIVGSKAVDMNPEFWLDMNNWNLQAALCSFFDYEGQNSSFIMKLPSMAFQTNTNFKEDLPPNHRFTYTTTVVNTGDETWPAGCTLRWCAGIQMSNEERVLLPTLVPGESSLVQVNLVTPDKAGYYNTQWRPATITGQFFGEMVFIIVQVLDDLQSVTQQLSEAHLLTDTEMGDPSVNSFNPHLSAAHLTSDTLAQTTITEAAAAAAACRFPSYDNSALAWHDMNTFTYANPHMENTSAVANSTATSTNTIPNGGDANEAGDESMI